MNTPIKWLTVVTMLLVSVATCRTANAQDSLAEKKAAVIDNIIVTAEKREQDLQKVPSAITALTGESLELRGLNTPQDLQYATPGLAIGEAYVGGVAQVSIRGVGMVNIYTGGDPGVPIHINGHYTQSTAHILRNFLDVERIEVQRGPQGTLYGRNAVGGNINIITKRPTRELESLVNLDFGNYDKRLVQAVLSGPISDRLRGRIVVSDEKRDGFITDFGIGGDRANSDYTAIRGALEIDLTDSVELYLNGYQFDDKSRRGMAQTVNANFDFSNPFTVRTNFATDNHDKSKGITADISWDLGNVEFRSLSAYDETEKNGGVDYDGTDIGRWENADSENNHDILTQEFQLLSTSDGPLQWASGLFYYEEESLGALRIYFDYTTAVIPLFDTNGDGVTDANDPRYEVVQRSTTKSESIAAYGQVTYAFSDQWELVAGIRYTKDEKSLAGFRLDSVEGGLEHGLLGFNLNNQNWDRSGDWEKVTGNLGLNYHVNDDVMLYASLSRGYKAGGMFFNAVGAVYDPEILDALELGLKGRWMNDRVQANLAGYYYDYTDKQEYQRLPPPDPGLSNIKNAAAATVYGVELETQAYLTDAFLVDAAFGYMSAEYDDFQTIDPREAGLGLQQYAGNKIPQSPEFKLNVGAQYEMTLGVNLGSLIARADYTWIDDQWAAGFNRDGITPLLQPQGDLIPSYHVVNVGLRWESPNTNWSAALYVQNATDERNVSLVSVFDANTSFHTYLPPRTYGLRITWTR